MSVLGYPELTPVIAEEYRPRRGMNWLQAAIAIAVGSLTLWGLLLFAVWQLV